MLENRPDQVQHAGPKARRQRDQLARLRAENARLRNENERLRAALDRHIAQGAIAPPPYAAGELTAGTCIGPGPSCPRLGEGGRRRLGVAGLCALMALLFALALVVPFLRHFYELSTPTGDVVAAWALGTMLGVGAMLGALRLLHV